MLLRQPSRVSLEGRVDETGALQFGCLSVETLTPALSRREREEEAIELVTYTLADHSYRAP